MPGLKGIDYNSKTYSDPTQLLDMLLLGDPTQVANVISQWQAVEKDLEAYNGTTTGTGGASFNGTVNGLFHATPPWQGQAADRYSQRTGDVSQYAMDLLNGISYSGAPGQNGVVTALTTVQAALQQAQMAGQTYAAQLTPLAAGDKTGLPTGIPDIPTSLTCQGIVDIANQMLQQYRTDVASALRNQTGFPALQPVTITLADDATVMIMLAVDQSGPLVDPTKVTGTVTVVQPPDVAKPQVPTTATLRVEGLRAEALYPLANEAVRSRAATALNTLASEYAKAVAQFPQPIDPSKLPKGVGGTGTNGGGYGAPPVPATGGVSPPVTDGVNDPKSNNGVTPLDNGSTSGATPTSSPLADSGLTNSANSGLTNSGLTDSGLNNSGLTDSGLANSGLTNPGVTGSGLTDTSPPTSVAGFTPPGTSGLGLTTPTPSSGLGSTNLPLTNVPTTGFTPSGGGIGGGFGSSGGVPLAAGLMPGLYGGTGASSGYPAEEGLGTAARQAASESALLNGESAAANAARSPGMYPPMFPPQMGQGANERNRSTFLPEEDVWTEDLDVAPPLIVGVSR